MKSKAVASVVVLLSAALSGCVHAKAKAMADAPALDVPPPPARVVETIETEAPPPATLPEEPRRNPVRPRPTAPAANAGQPPRPPAPAADVPVAPETPPVAAEEPKPATPPTTLQTIPAGQEGEVERGIRTTLTRASQSLNRIDYRALNADARTQYDTAKRFIQQAEDAIKAKNLVFAKSFADKAATLAAQLGGGR